MIFDPCAFVFTPDVNKGPRYLDSACVVIRFHYANELGCPVNKHGASQVQVSFIIKSSFVREGLQLLVAFVDACFSLQEGGGVRCIYTGSTCH